VPGLFPPSLLTEYEQIELDFASTSLEGCFRDLEEAEAEFQKVRVFSFYSAVRVDSFSRRAARLGEVIEMKRNGLTLPHRNPSREGNSCLWRVSEI